MTNKTPSLGNKQLDQAAEKFDAFDTHIKTLTMDELNKAPKIELEPSVLLSQREIANSKEIHLKPIRVIGCQDKFNEKFRADWEYQKQEVPFIAENKETQGEALDLWTRPFGGVPAMEWMVPVGKPVWGPRYLAEQIKRKGYHVLSMSSEDHTPNNMVSEGSSMSYVGKMVVKSFKQRLDAVPVSQRKSVFMSNDDWKTPQIGQ
jgi:hypothetical protein